jgi:hypothetical protein
MIMPSFSRFPDQRFRVTSYSLTHSQVYVALLASSSPSEIRVTVDGPYDIELLDDLANSTSLSSQYLQDMAPGDHLRFITDRNFLPGEESFSLTLFTSAQAAP